MTNKNKCIIGIVIVLILASIPLFFYFKDKEGIVSRNEFIQISNIKAGQVIESPLLIKGVVTGGKWAGFEGQVGRVELIDSNDNVLGMAPLTATSDFMKLPTSFEAILTFNNLKGNNFTLVFHNENPSGLSEEEETMVLPVKVLAE